MRYTRERFETVYRRLRRHDGEILQADTQAWHATRAVEELEGRVAQLEKGLDSLHLLVAEDRDRQDRVIDRIAALEIATAKLGDRPSQPASEGSPSKPSFERVNETVNYWCEVEKAAEPVRRALLSGPPRLGFNILATAASGVSLRHPGVSSVKILADITKRVQAVP